MGSIRDEFPANLLASAEFPEDGPVCGARTHQKTVRAFDQTIDKTKTILQRRWRIEDPAVCDDADKALERRFRQCERLAAGGEVSYP